MSKASDKSTKNYEEVMFTLESHMYRSHLIKSKDYLIWGGKFENQIEN